MLPSMMAAHLGMTDSKPDASPKGKQPAKGTGDADHHLRAARSSLKKGDHKTAKKHALKAVNTLHRSAPAEAPVIPAVPSAA